VAVSVSAPAGSPGICGSQSPARMARSCRKRPPSRPACITLMATCFWNAPSSRTALKTAPMPPRPASPVTRYGPKRWGTRRPRPSSIAALTACPPRASAVGRRSTSSRRLASTAAKTRARSAGGRSATWSKSSSTDCQRSGVIPRPSLLRAGGGPAGSRGAEITFQPRFGQAHFPGDRGNRNTEHSRDLLARQSTKVFEFNEAALALIEAGQLLKGIIELLQRAASLGSERDRVVDRHLFAFAALAGAMLTGIVHQDLAHDPAGDREEVRAAVPLPLIVIHELKI